MPRESLVPFDSLRSVRPGWLVTMALAVLLVAMPGCGSTPPPAPPPPENAPPPPPPPPARRIVLSVGVDRFASDRIPPNLAAVKDATDVAEALGRAGNAMVVTRTLMDEQATKAALEEQLQQIATMCDDRFDDTVIVYLATCGAPVSMPSGPKIPVGPTRLFIALSDANPDDLRESCLPVDALATLWKCQAERVIVLLDCGFGRESRSIGLSAIDPAHVENLVERHTADITGGPFAARALVFGTEMNQPVRTDMEGRSTFATTLLGALGGAADANHDERVTLKEAVSLISQRTGNEVSPIRVLIGDLSTGNAVLTGQPDEASAADVAGGS